MVEPPSVPAPALAALGLPPRGTTTRTVVSASGAASGSPEAGASDMATTAGSAMEGRRRRSRPQEAEEPRSRAPRAPPPPPSRPDGGARGARKGGGARRRGGRAGGARRRPTPRPARALSPRRGRRWVEVDFSWFGLVWATWRGPNQEKSKPELSWSLGFVHVGGTRSGRAPSPLSLGWSRTGLGPSRHCLTNLHCLTTSTL